MSKTHVAAVIDESSSMWNLQDATIDGFNEYIDELMKDIAAAEETTVSLTKFSGVANVVYTDKPLHQVPRLDRITYSPQGSTALYDAIGLTVGQLAPKVRKEDTAIVIVLTDGHENVSKENTREDILNLITRKESEGNWTFVYLGANQDAFAVGTQIGFKGGNTASYFATADSVKDTYSSLATNTSNLRSRSRSSKERHGAQYAVASSTFFDETGEDEGGPQGSTSS